MNTNCVVFGAVSSGKSTFINALLQKNLCKTGDGITTREKAEFNLGNLVIIDLPGINENGDVFVNKHRKDFINAFAVFCIFDKTSAGTIKQYYNEVMKLRRDRSRVYFILNKIDEIDDINDVLKDVRRTVGNQEVFTISSRLAQSVHSYRDGDIDENNLKFLKQYSFTRNLTEEDIVNAYDDSRFIEIKEKIEELSETSKVNFYQELSFIIESNSAIPNEVYFKAIEDYTEYEKERNRKIKIVSALTGGVIGVGLLSAVTIGSLVLLIPSGGASGAVGAAAITSGLAALGPGGMLGGVATASAVSVGAASAGAVGGTTAGYVSGKTGTSLLSKTKLNISYVNNIEITPEDEKMINQIYKKEYEKEYSKFNRFLPDEFKRNEKTWYGSEKYNIVPSYKEMIGSTYAYFNDNFYLVNMVYSVNPNNKSIIVHNINSTIRLILDKE